MKKYLATGVLALAGLACATPAQAWPGYLWPGKNWMHNYSIGAEFSKYTYKEPGVMKESGTFHGISGEYTNRGLGSFEEFSTYLAAQLRYMRSGNVKYDGATWGGTAVTIAGIDQYYLEGRVLAGMTVGVAPGVALTPYTGLGGRHLIDKMNEKDHPGAYRRQSNYLYMPFGLMGEFNFRGGLRLSATGEFNALLRGRQRSRLGETPPILGLDPETNILWHTPDSWQVSNTQNEGYGLRFDIKAEKMINPVTSVFIQPFIRYWHIQDSERELSGGRGTWTDPGDPTKTEEVVRYVWEPRNRTTEFGLRFGFNF